MGLGRGVQSKGGGGQSVFINVIFCNDYISTFIKFISCIYTHVDQYFFHSA